MPIDGVSQVRRLPRLGKIRLGIVAETQSGKEYPKAVDYFVLPDDDLGREIAKHYGERPKAIDVVFPVESREDVFPQYLKCYRKSVGLWCKGDGKTAQRVAEGGKMHELPCPCEEQEEVGCRRMANLRFLIPVVSLAGVWQLDTSSFHTIVNVNSGLDAVERIAGRISGVPCVLSVVPIEVSPEGRKQTRWVLELHMASPSRIQELAGRLQKLREELGACRLGLPSPQQAKYEETDLIPASVHQELPAPKESAPEPPAAPQAQEPEPPAKEEKKPEPPPAPEKPAEKKPAATAKPGTIGEEGAKRLTKIVKGAAAEAGADPLKLRAALYAKYKVARFSELTAEQAEAIEKTLTAPAEEEEEQEPGAQEDGL